MIDELLNASINVTDLSKLFRTINDLANRGLIAPKFRELNFVQKAGGQQYFNFGGAENGNYWNTNEISTAALLGKEMALRGCPNLILENNKTNKAFLKKYEKTKLKIEKCNFTYTDKLYWDNIKNIPGRIQIYKNDYTFELFNTTYTVLRANQNENRIIGERNLGKAIKDFEKDRGIREYNSLTKDYFNLLHSLPTFVADELHTWNKPFKAKKDGFNINFNCHTAENNVTATITENELFVDGTKCFMPLFIETCGKEISNHLYACGITRVEPGIFGDAINDQLERKSGWEKFPETFKLVQTLNKANIKHTIKLNNSTTNFALYPEPSTFYKNEENLDYIAKCVIISSGMQTEDVEKIYDIQPIKLPYSSPTRLNDFTL